MQPKPKPIRKEKIGIITYKRVPEIGPIIPRLKEKYNKTEVIGFGFYQNPDPDDKAES